LEGKPAKGESVSVVSSEGKFLGYGAYSPDSQIIARVWSWNEQLPVGPELIRTKVAEAAGLRKSIVFRGETNAYRLIFSESDGIPGLIADRFGDFIVCQFTSAGAEYWKKDIVKALHEMVPCKGIFERSDLSVRRKEGLGESTGVLWGEQPPPWVEITEEGRRFSVSIHEGHKTGYYLDQRDNHTLAENYAGGRQVLDCFTYTGGFAVAALKGNATHVTLVDSSGPALEAARRNIGLNGFPDDRFSILEADVFKLLRSYRDENRTFDMIILDPPKFIDSIRHIEKGARAYKDINLLAFKLLNPGGILFTFSCSGHMEDSLFQKVVADAALDAGREMRIIKWLGQATDHPVAGAFPEGKYLKGLMVIVP
jgi:23S rRNA (cytosine1962-C5)-methyltransferase